MVMDSTLPCSVLSMLSIHNELPSSHLQHARLVDGDDGRMGRHRLHDLTSMKDSTTREKIVECIWHLCFPFERCRLRGGQGTLAVDNRFKPRPILALVRT